jgi:hypothetical protein
MVIKIFNILYGGPLKWLSLWTIPSIPFLKKWLFLYVSKLHDSEVISKIWFPNVWPDFKGFGCGKFGLFPPRKSQLHHFSRRPPFLLPLALASLRIEFLCMYRPYGWGIHSSENTNIFFLLPHIWWIIFKCNAYFSGDHHWKKLHRNNVP